MAKAPESKAKEKAENQEFQVNEDTANKILMQKKSYAFKKRLDEVNKESDKRYHTLTAQGQDSIAVAKGKPFWDELLGTKERPGTLIRAIQDVAKNFDAWASLVAEFVGLLCDILHAAAKSKSLKRTFKACTHLFIAELKKQYEDILFSVKPKLEDFEIKGVTLTQGWRELAKEVEPLNSLEQWINKVREWQNLGRIKNFVLSEENALPEIEFDFKISKTGKVVWSAHINACPISDPELQSHLGGALDAFFIKMGCTIGAGNQLYQCDKDGQPTNPPIPATSELMKDLNNRVIEAKLAIGESLEISTGIRCR